MAKTPSELREYNRQWFKSPLGRYHQHKGKSLYRGIEFLLTFEEWWDLWQTSGKWEERGRRKDQYVMARFGDQGAYELGNVRICLAGDNTDEMRLGLPPRSRRSPEEQKAANRIYAAKSRKRQGHVVKDHIRSKKALGRRIVVRDGIRCWAHPGDTDYP